MKYFTCLSLILIFTHCKERQTVRTDRITQLKSDLNHSVMLVSKWEHGNWDTTTRKQQKHQHILFTSICVQRPSQFKSKLIYNQKNKWIKGCSVIHRKCFKSLKPWSTKPYHQTPELHLHLKRKLSSCCF